MNGISGYLKNIGRAKAGIFAVLFLILFFGGLRAANAAQLIWQSCEVGTLATGIDYEHPYSRIAGYQFTPAKNGAVTKLCGYFNATRNVTLYDSSYSSLWTVSISSSNNWSCAAITPVNVASGASYFVMADSGYNGAYRYLPPYSLPLTCGSTTINNGVTEYLQESNPCLSTSFDSCYDVSTDYIEGMTDVEITYGDPPSVNTTVPASSITGTSAVLGGNVTSDGGGTVTERGTCWSTKGYIVENCASAGSGGLGAFSQTRTGMPPLSNIWYVSYAKNIFGTTYDTWVNFATTAAPPTVSGQTVTDIAQISAKFGVNISSFGGYVTYGSCWGTSAGTVTNCLDGGGTVTTGWAYQFRTGLPAGTTIYYKVYATNAGGTTYGSVSSFSTRSPTSGNALWQSCEVGTLATGIDYETYSRIAGYQFTPAKNGQVVKLCGYFNATRNVTLYDSSYSSLWTASISSSNNWSCAAITPVNVASGASYFVMADSGYNGAYRYLPPYSLPLTCGSTTINNGVTEYLQESNPCLSTSFDSCYDVSTDYIEGMTDVEITYPDPPTLLSPTVSAVGTSVATLGAAITSDGGAAITARGTCWGTSPAPTTNCAAAGGTATGTFTQARTGLPPGTPLYYRGYAANGVATGYSPDGTFTTNVAVPTLTSPTVSSVSQTTAVLGANITNNGGGAITERGACWGTSPAPTTNCAAAGGTAMGVFTQSRTGLPTATLIYYRGYGKNSAGAGYSPDGSFTTLSNPSVSSITPAGAQNNATATISSITGTDFMSGIAVKLAKTGQADVACDGFTVINASALSSGECPITGVAAGYWNVVARNADSQTATLANGFNVSEACASTQGTIATSCIFPAAVGGVDNSNLVINSGATLTIGAGQTVVWNPGKQVVVNGSVAFVGSGQLKKTNLWAIDADSDGHSSDATLYAVDTAPAGGRRLQYITDFSDCNDNNVSVWANGYVAGADGDGDGYYASYSYGCNNGAASHGQTDCCDSDTRANPGAGGYYTTTDNCGSFDYNCNYVNELKDTQTSQCSVNYSNNICTFIRSEGWSEGVPACGQNGITSGYRVIEIEIIAPATCSDCGTALPQGNMLGTQACR